MEKIKVLVITHAPWRNDTHIGNSYSNLFVGMTDRIEFAQIYIRDGLPENNLVHKYFHISEKSLLKSIFTRTNVGSYFYLEEPIKTPKVVFSNKYNVLRKLRWDIFLLVRDIASSLGKWKTRDLARFISDFEPDIIFGTFIFTPIINQLMIYAKNHSNAKLVLYSWDDWYRLNKFSRSPFYYFRHVIENFFQKKCAEASTLMYTITEQMKTEYENIFSKNCKLLMKGYDFRNNPYKEYTVSSDSIKFVYTGNIGDKRWIVLSVISKVLAKINRNSSKKLTLDIYTMSPVDNIIKKSLNVDGTSCIKGAIPVSEVYRVQTEADILVHVEPTDKNKLELCRSSFSTKIVDYFFKGKCILAVGGENASMKYLKMNDAAIVVNELDDLEFTIRKIVEDPQIISAYAKKAWECGARNHNIADIQDMLYNDFLNLKEG